MLSHEYSWKVMIFDSKISAGTLTWWNLFLLIVSSIHKEYFILLDHLWFSNKNYIQTRYKYIGMVKKVFSVREIIFRSMKCQRIFFCILHGYPANLLTNIFHRSNGCIWAVFWWRKVPEVIQVLCLQRNERLLLLLVCWPVPE